jgi:hypothetical protein
MVVVCLHFTLISPRKKSIIALVQMKGVQRNPVKYVTVQPATKK